MSTAHSRVLLYVYFTVKSGTVCEVHCLERHCVCTAQCREDLCVFCTV